MRFSEEIFKITINNSPNYSISTSFIEIGVIQNLKNYCFGEPQNVRIRLACKKDHGKVSIAFLLRKSFLVLNGLVLKLKLAKKRQNLISDDFGISLYSLVTPLKKSQKFRQNANYMASTKFNFLSN